MASLRHTHRSWKSRVLDYLVYVAIGLLSVCVTLVVAVHISDPDIASQVITALFSATLVIAYLVAENWKGARRDLLLICCAAVLLTHLVAYAIAFRLAGRTRAILAGPATLLEIALFSYALQKVMCKRANSKQ